MDTPKKCSVHREEPQVSGLTVWEDFKEGDRDRGHNYRGLELAQT